MRRSATRAIVELMKKRYLFLVVRSGGSAALWAEMSDGSDLSSQPGGIVSKEPITYPSGDRIEFSSTARPDLDDVLSAILERVVEVLRSGDPDREVVAERLASSYSLLAAHRK